MGLLDRLGIKRVVSLPRPTYRFEAPPENGVRNLEGIHAFSLQLAEAVSQVIRSGGFPLVLGGDCSILLGSLLGLGATAPCGLVFIDGHLDYLTPQTSSTSGVAGMDLAIATGLGPERLTSLSGPQPLVSPGATAAVAFRDGDDLEDAAREAGLILFDASTASSHGLDSLARSLLPDLNLTPAHRIWIHVDVDVLATEYMPAVDSPQPGGLSFTHLEHLLRGFLTLPIAAGLQITIYDPELDPDGTAGRGLVDCLVGAFSGKS